MSNDREDCTTPEGRAVRSKSSRDMNVQLVNVDGTESNREGTQHETDKEGIDELKGRKWIV